jgi:Ca2+-binding EF-hand superfamily protein
MRSISLNPTNEELDDMINEIETDLHEDFKLKKEVEQENKKEVEKENKNDKNKNKKEKKCVARIDFPEFLAFLARKSITDDEDSLKEAFNMFSNESQHIDTDSMIKVLKDLGEPVFREGYEDTVKTLIEQSDIDGDSKISFEGKSINFCFLFCISTIYFNNKIKI